MGLSLALYEKDFSVLDKGGRGGEEGREGRKQGQDTRRGQFKDMLCDTLV